ncbi:TPA: DUF2513 domain-containing protein [Bacillus paranthracis]|nr:DUF2513 domain-containing protein [Bacillus paranthracis]HDR7523509.1 DUF2513 domain-containing protein [Bacillus paranthracis]
MKRNEKLMRTLMIQIEESDPQEKSNFVPGEGSKYTYEEIQYHLHLMLKEKLILGRERTSVDGIVVDVYGLTPKGHDYLDALIRKPKVDEEKKKWWNNNPLFDFFIAVIKKWFGG